MKQKIMSSESPRKKSRQVCLICGSYTTLIVNIYEPRSGPNIVDLINQKFGPQPLNEDKSNKFLCYSCNNWLINWHSLQNKNEASSSKTSSKNKRFNQSIPEEQQHETMAVLVDRYSDVLKLRSNLSKYFYYPYRASSKIPDSAIIKTKCSKLSHSGGGIKMTRKKYRSFRSRFINKKHFRFCHQQRKQTAIQSYYTNKSSNLLFRMARKKRTKEISLSHISQRRMLEQRSSQTIVVNPYVVSRLNQLGTTVVREGTSATDAANDLSRCITNNYRKKIDHSVIQSGSGDILIAFNTVLQEVFPVDLSEEKDVVVEEDISTIFERIPKSLSITLV